MGTRNESIGDNTKKRKSRGFEHKVILKVDGKLLELMFPTSEQARMMVTYLKRCLNARSYFVDYEYLTPVGFISLFKNGQEPANKSEKTFNVLEDIRKSSACARLTVDIFRDEKFGGDLGLEFYTYSMTDAHFLNNLLRTGLDRVWITIQLEERDRRFGTWKTVTPRSFCDSEFAPRINRLTFSEKQRLNELLDDIKAKRQK